MAKEVFILWYTGPFVCIGVRWCFQVCSPLIHTIETTIITLAKKAWDIKEIQHVHYPTHYIYTSGKCQLTSFQI